MMCGLARYFPPVLAAEFAGKQHFNEKLINLICDRRAHTHASPKTTRESLQVGAATGYD